MLLVRRPAVLLSRFLIKAPEGPPRKDGNLPNVILSEKRNIRAAAHQVRDRELFSSILFAAWLSCLGGVFWCPVVKRDV